MSDNQQYINTLMELINPDPREYIGKDDILKGLEKFLDHGFIPSAAMSVLKATMDVAHLDPKEWLMVLCMVTGKDVTTMQLELTHPRAYGKKIYEIENRHLGSFLAATNFLRDRLGSVTGGKLRQKKIKEIFLTHGFTIKEGQSDLKPYVYEAAEALIAAALDGEFR